MTVSEGISLALHTTFHIGGPAQFFAIAYTEEDVQSAIVYARERKVPITVLGGGSNLLVPDVGISGLVLTYRGSESLFEENDSYTEVIAEAGHVWDTLVQKAGERSLFGIENLAGIPGTVGGALVQNIGAYGAELAETFAWASVVDASTGIARRIEKEEADFSYRSSLFKKHPELIITKVAIRLSSQGEPKLSYPDLVEALAQGTALSTPAEIAEVIRGIRMRKFPDLSQTGTAGSFFKNPIVEKELAETLIKQFSDLRHFPQKDGREKIALAWILDHVLQLKGFRRGSVSLFERQPLVIVAEKGATANEVDALAHEVAKKVFEVTGITIEREVETFGTRVIHT